MSSHCKDCERLQTPQVGTAPDRPTFQQPNMYDHFTNFQKFKQFKEEIKSHQEESSQIKQSKFTDFQIKHELMAKGDLPDFATFRQQPDADELQKQNSADDSNASAKSLDDESNIMLSLQKKKSLLTISRTPIMCPISNCNRSIGITSLLSHYLRDHHDEFDVQCQEIFMGKSSTLIFDPNVMEYGDNICFGALAYGGIADDSSSRPAERGICNHNAFLPETHEKLEAHLPILIMACRTSWATLLTDQELENKISPVPDSPMQELLVIWLASVQTTKPMQCTLIVRDKLMTSSRGAVMRVRHLNDPQNPSEFMLKDINCLRLSHGEINVLSQNRTDCIKIEFLINE